MRSLVNTEQMKMKVKKTQHIAFPTTCYGKQYNLRLEEKQ